MFRYHVTKKSKYAREMFMCICVCEKEREKTGTKLTGHPVKLTDRHLESTDGLGEVHVL